MSIPYPIRITLLIVILLAAIGWSAKQCGLLAKKSPHELTDTIDLNGLTYTSIRPFCSKKIGFAKAQDDKTYIGVEVIVDNPKSKRVKPDTAFKIIDNKGIIYDLDMNATMNTGDVPFGVIRPNSFWPFTIVFSVPEKSMDSSWTLLLKDGESTGKIKIGSATKVLPQDDPAIITDSEAIDHIGEMVEVRGVVYEVELDRKSTLMFLGGKSPNRLFTVAVELDILGKNNSFLKPLEGKEIGIIGRPKLTQGTPSIFVRVADQIKVEWKTAKEDPIDYLNGLVNDKYRNNLGLFRPLSETELRRFKTYLDQNVKGWQDKDDEELWKFVPRFYREI